ncbi:MAG: hypothetical protein KatS3mg032_0337 [Cyclobacteriaceae bacterium]|nr:MAG: hypothetical protein KatS3mg032_0337 [Cyclobacteriaceae bacterium]
MLHLLNLFFLVFHTIVILFNLTGWLIPRLRKLHLFSLSVTAFSWFVLGWWYGWGYCFCTDWHWQVREALGLPNPSHSYTHFLVVQYFSWNPDPQWVDRATLAGFIIAWAGALRVNLCKRKGPAG